MSEFASSCINLRQVLDWAFFVEKNGKDVDWDWHEGVLDEFGMRDLYNVFNAICVGDLGFSINNFWQIQFLPDLKEKVLEALLSTDIQFTEPKYLLPRVLFKYRRWKSNEWKRELCYNNSAWSAFWSGVWSHILKPKSI